MDHLENSGDVKSNDIGIPAPLNYQPNHRLDAEILMQQVLEKDRTWLYAHPDAMLDRHVAESFLANVKRRIAGEPIAYITGNQEFWSLSFSVTPSVLVPRQDTELLVELVLNVVQDQQGSSVLELGTGSGAISIALLHERPDLHIVATDESLSALDVARRNKVRHHADSLKLIKSDWFENLAPHRFDVIVSNPPYIALGDPHLQLPGVRKEPQLALTSGADGLDAIRHIARGAKQFLRPEGRLIFEHGYDQDDPIKSILLDLQYHNIQCHLDHAGNARVTSAVS